MEKDNRYLKSYKDSEYTLTEHENDRILIHYASGKGGQYDSFSKKFYAVKKNRKGEEYIVIKGEKIFLDNLNYIDNYEQILIDGIKHYFENIENKPAKYYEIVK